MSKVGVVVFAFGYPREVYANRFLALVARFTSFPRHLPVFAQQDIPLEPGHGLGGLTFCPQEGNTPPSTWQVAVRAARWVRRNDLKGIIVVAAAPHRTRALRDMRLALAMLGLNTIAETSSNADADDTTLWFRGDSRQWHTKHRWVWRVREMLLRWLPLPLYKRLVC